GQQTHVVPAGQTGEQRPPALAGRRHTWSREVGRHPEETQEWHGARAGLTDGTSEGKPRPRHVWRALERPFRRTPNVRSRPRRPMGLSRTSSSPHVRRRRRAAFLAARDRRDTTRAWALGTVLIRTRSGSAAGSARS